VKFLLPDSALDDKKGRWVINKSVDLDKENTYQALRKGIGF
jgi:hypothetical protein